jgi:tripartite-type tricarboxylate transporter receptor subunit TctC
MAMTKPSAVMKLIVAVALAVVTGGAAATAQTYPSRPITVIVPFAAGGVTDIVARIVSERMKTALSQSVHEIVPREQQTPEALAAYHKAEIAKWWPIIKAANIKLE